MNINNIEELLLFVNGELQKGKSISRIEKELFLGKDTLRKKLNREGYFFVRSEKKFIKKNNQEITKKTSIPKNTSNKKGITENNKSIIKEYESNKALNTSEIAEVKELLKIKNELLEIVKNKNINKNNKGINIIEEIMSFDKANRKKATFNLDLELIEKLKEYEQCSNISKSDVVNIAIKNYLINQGIIKQ